MQHKWQCLILLVIKALKTANEWSSCTWSSSWQLNTKISHKLWSRLGLGRAALADIIVSNPRTAKQTFYELKQCWNHMDKRLEQMGQQKSTKAVSWGGCGNSPWTFGALPCNPSALQAWSRAGCEQIPRTPPAADLSQIPPGIKKKKKDCIPWQQAEQMPSQLIFKTNKICCFFNSPMTLKMDKILKTGMYE